MEDFFYVSFVEEIPKYIQITNHIKELIDKKIIVDGTKLPTIREYSKFLLVNNITIVNAYNKLSSDGYARQKVGSGTYAKFKESTFKFNKEYSNSFKKLSEEGLKNIIDFSGETNKEIMFPIEDFKEILNKILDRDGQEALISQNPMGYHKLRSTINRVFWQNKLWDDDVLIVSGAQQGIDIASKVMVNINDNVIVEKPTYGGALSVFKWRRANIFEVNILKDGIDLVEFEKILKKNKITCFYTMSYFQNPTGISYSYEKKVKLLELAEKYDFYIIEDDYLSELIYDEDIKYEPFKWLDKNDRVIYIKSFSKIFLPGIRIGYMIPPKIFKEAMGKSKFNTDIATSSLMQRALELYISEGKWKKNIQNLSKEYKKRYKIMEKYIDNELKDIVKYHKPKGGLTFYLTLSDKSISSIKLFKRLKKKGVYITPGVLFFTNFRDGEYTFRIGFSETNKEKIILGLTILKEEMVNCHTLQ